MSRKISRTIPGTRIIYKPTTIEGSIFCQKISPAQYRTPALYDPHYMGPPTVLPRFPSFYSSLYLKPGSNHYCKNPCARNPPPPPPPRLVPAHSGLPNWHHNLYCASPLHYQSKQPLLMATATSIASPPLPRQNQNQLVPAQTACPLFLQCRRTLSTNLQEFLRQKPQPLMRHPPRTSHHLLQRRPPPRILA